MDFLGRFGGAFGDDPDNGLKKSKSKSIISEEIELSLDLSTNGCFGVDLKGKSKLIRSSSIASILPLPKTEIEEVSVPMVPTGSLVRTTSLPVESEEVIRKRKEMQFLKRLEVKRKRLERRNSLKSAVSSKEKSDSVDFGTINSCQNGISGGGVVNGFSSFGVRAVSLGSQGSSCSAGTSEIVEVKSIPGIMEYYLLAYIILCFLTCMARRKSEIGNHLMFTLLEEICSWNLLERLKLYPILQIAAK